MQFRNLRLNKLIREELAKLMKREIYVDGAILTVTEVSVSKKLDSAEVFVSVLPAGKELEAMNVLRKSQPDLQYKLLRTLNIKPMPRVHFVADHGPENAAKVEAGLLEDEIEKGE